MRQQSEGQRAVYATHLGRLDDVVPGVDGEVPELAVLLVEVPDVHGVVVGDELVAGRPLHHVDLRLEVVRLVGLAHLDDAEHHDEDGRPDVQVLPRHIESHAEDDRRRKCPGDECLKALRRLSFLVPLGDILPEALLVLAFEIGVVSVILPVLEVLRADAVGAVHVDGVLLQVRLDLRQRPRPGPHHHRAARPPSLSRLSFSLSPLAHDQTISFSLPPTDSCIFLLLYLYFERFSLPHKAHHVLNVAFHIGDV